MAKDLKKKWRENMRKTLNSEPFSTSKYGEVTEWIDTGDYGLNRIISGDIYKGIPAGRVIVFSGESQSGKTYISAQTAANALNKNKYDVVFYFDGEGGAMKDFFAGRGCNLDNVEHVLVDSVEDALKKIMKTYTQVGEIQKEDPNFKCLFILDSLGALVTNKVYDDIEKKDKVANDMGLRAKVCNLMVKATTIPSLRTNVPFIIINHVYEDPNAMYKSKIKKQSGGLGIQFMARLVIQCSQRFEKDDKDNEDKKNFQWSRLKFFTVKNAFGQPTHETEMILDFNKGPLKLYSIFKAAVDYGFIEKSGSWYTIPSSDNPEKKYRSSQLLLEKELWKSFIDDFNKKSIEDLSYGGKEILDPDMLSFEDMASDISKELN